MAYLWGMNNAQNKTAMKFQTIFTKNYGREKLGFYDLNGERYYVDVTEGYKGMTYLVRGDFKSFRSLAEVKKYLLTKHA